MIDVRDIITRVEQLEDEKREDTCECNHSDTDHKANDDDPEYAPCSVDECLCEDYDEDDGLDDDETKELATLTELLEELRGNGGNEQWRGSWYPITLVRESHFQDFAQQEAEDLGLINDDARWPANCIDWEQAANELLADYSSVEFDGVTYHYNA